MGKTTKPTKWFKAVKKAFRSPSKERPSPTDKKGDADEKLLTKQDFPPVSYPARTPHPLPSFEIVTHNVEVEPQYSHGRPPLTTPDHAVEPAAIAANHLDKPKHSDAEEEQHHSRNTIYVVDQKRQDDDDDSAFSEEEEAATRIQQRFSSPLALKGLIRLQALVRGQLVRRQAATTLRTMEAIVRVQSLFRGRRVRMSKDGRAVKTRISRIRRLSSRAGVAQGDVRREAFQEMEPETSEAEHEANKRKRRTAYLLTQQLKRSTPNRSSSFIDCDPDQPHEGWAWLELWTNAKAWENSNRQQMEAELKDSKDFIEIIPNSRRMSDFTTVKEVDNFNTLKVKHYENTLDATSSNGVIPEAHQKATSPGGKSTNLTTPSPAVSEDAIPDNVPTSPQASDASVSAPGLESSGGEDDDPSMAMEHLVLPEAANGEEAVPNGATSTTHSDSFSTSNGVHQPGGEDTSPVNGEVLAAADVVTGNGHHENGENKLSRKEESPIFPASKRATCRYMAATESAKAKFRSSSNPKTRGSGTPEPPESPTPKPRSSIGGGTVISKAAESPGKTVAFGTRKTTSNVQNRRSPSPKTGAGPREKPRSVDAGHGGVSPARRNSLGGDDKRWRT